MVIATPEPEVTLKNTNNPLPDADAHMQDLAWFLGNWTIQSRTLVDRERDEWLEETLCAEHTLELGGHLIFEHFFGPMNGTPFEAWSLRKYNDQTGKWEQRWVDTSPGGFANWIGMWSASDQRFIGYAARFVDDQLQLTGTDGMREIFDQIAEDRFAWRLEQTRDGGSTWKIIWTLVYTRQTGKV
ncbi:MAG TPA: DUF1579 family protein [Phototrophicaceae bacterium]|jgi:hypothetical protein|nr:DUF1579 family protein [Phototrophicaceae bacterium]